MVLPSTRVGALASAVLVVATVVGGCSPRASVAVDAGAACPATPPITGDACAVPGQRCAYDHCAISGLVTASCGTADGGSGMWSVTTVPCGDCNGRSCVSGTVCMERQGGALLTDCGTHTCGSGPLGCDCLCGAGVECAIVSYAGTGPIYTCRVGCGASICP